MWLHNYRPSGRNILTPRSGRGIEAAWDDQYTDPETGLIYLRARYYDPTTAQFLTRDPLDALTRSAYGYVNGNPLNGSDPTGLCSVNPFSSKSCLNSVGNAVNQVQRAVIDVVAVPPYLAYDLSYYGLKAINSFGDQFGPVGTVVSRVVGAPLLIPEAFGLGTDIGIDWIKGEDWADESRNQCDTRSINPLHSQGFVPSFLRGGPKLYLPGAYRDGQGDPHVKWEW